MLLFLWLLFFDVVLELIWLYVDVKCCLCCMDVGYFESLLLDLVCSLVL